ncbi:DUF6973 domain-containing protein [Salinimicrobium sp. HB62]|uniref:DUF6973 domain-containing protein n=1 Tax=Salinimicrobium sp. HB62 TaxID=3077781 RepID=UPI002D78A403|nr:hypothetical protein [Salinimicrobium sp. HB62]
MAIGKRIASLNFKELAILSGIFLKHPLYLIPTCKATNRTVKICNQLYGALHHEDNKTNAFRHALWNYLICKYCLSVAGSVEKAAGWSKKITDLHERLSPNSGLAKAMDLHNNRIGRELFTNSLDKDVDVVSLIQQKTKEAVKVRSLNDIEKSTEDLVFIEEIRS